MPTCRATAEPEAIMTWFCAMTVTVAPEMASRPDHVLIGRDWPTSILSATDLPRYWAFEVEQCRFRNAQQQDGLGMFEHLHAHKAALRVHADERDHRLARGQACR